MCDFVESVIEFTFEGEFHGNVAVDFHGLGKKMARFVTYTLRFTISAVSVYRTELILLLLLLPILCRAAFYCRIIAHWRSGQEELVRS